MKHDKSDNPSGLKNPTGMVSHPGNEPFGYVIGNLDPTLREMLDLPEECASIGIVSSKKKSASVFFGADEAVK